MKVLVTGGTGFVGSHVVRAIQDAGHDVRALVRKGSVPGAERAEGDMTDSESLRRAAQGVDAVVHLVAIRQGREEQFQRVMVDGTRDLLAAAREAGVGRFVHMSALGTSGNPNVSTASVFVTTLSPCSSIFNKSRVSGMSPGSRSVTSAFARMNAIGTWIDSRCTPSARFRRVHSSFQLTTSGPPSSNVRFAASGRSSAWAKNVPTSSTQTGWIRCFPEPTIGVTGATFASLRKVGRIPPSRPKTKLGRKITCSRPDSRTSPSCSHFAP